MALNLTAAQDFLKNTMYDTTDKMYRESTSASSPNYKYYVNSANGLAFSVMHEYNYTQALEHLNQTVAIKADVGKGSDTLRSHWADLFHPLWKSKIKVDYQFRNTNEQTWETLSHGVVYSNNADGSLRSTSDNKINTLCHYVMHEMLLYYTTGTSSHLTNASGVWSTILSKFDDNAGGYVDEIPDYREAYKQALVKICSDRFPELAAIGTYTEPTGFFSNTLQDSVTGGIYARYIRSGGNIVNNGSTFPNTEATACIVLAYR